MQHNVGDVAEISTQLLPICRQFLQFDPSFWIMYSLSTVLLYLGSVVGVTTEPTDKLHKYLLQTYSILGLTPRASCTINLEMLLLLYFANGTSSDT